MGYLIGSVLFIVGIIVLTSIVSGDRSDGIRERFENDGTDAERTMAQSLQDVTSRRG